MLDPVNGAWESQLRAGQGSMHWYCLQWLAGRTVCLVAWPALPMGSARR